MYVPAINDELLTSTEFRFHLVLSLVKSLVNMLTSCSELVICVLTFGGPLIVLVTVLVSNVYMVVKPFISKLLQPWMTYDEAFSQGRRDVAKAWLKHAELWHR